MFLSFTALSFSKFNPDDFELVWHLAEDPDGDGLDNLLEFALATDPSSGASHAVPALAGDAASSVRERSQIEGVRRSRFIAARSRPENQFQ